MSTEPTSDLEVTPGWLSFHASPSKPTFAMPRGAVDAHCHVFGPGHRFPYARERKSTPCDASSEQLFALRDFLGFERNVIVQATCHGSDNRALIDALEHSQGCARGVATVKRSISDAELEDLHAAGVHPGAGLLEGDAGGAGGTEALRSLEEAAAVTPPLRDIASQLHVLGHDTNAPPQFMPPDAAHIRAADLDLHHA